MPELLKKRTFVSFPVEDALAFSDRLLAWGAPYEYASFLYSNRDRNSEQNSPERNGTYDLIAAFGAASILCPVLNPDSFEELRKYHERISDWIFGHLSYDLKNQCEGLHSENFDGLSFPEMHFFQPKYLFLLKERALQVGYLAEFSDEAEIENLMAQINGTRFVEIPLKDLVSKKVASAKMEARVSKAEYLQAVNELKEHIHRGDIYETNFCMEFYSDEVRIDPQSIYVRLNELSQTPFSAYYRIKDRYAFSASPERFLKKNASMILSQPIKGTIRRGKDEVEDNKLKRFLHQNKKERNENVMIVDLVRNDLSRSARRGSVRVDELYGIYSFRQVHQMVSSISAELRPGFHFTQALKNAFPMGSMTGAPKVKAMELIEEYEKTKRGLYSGALGYITPDADFDFNVVIRSILYNAGSGYLSFMVGSAITNQADPEQEYEECMLKAKALFETLSDSYAFAI